MFGAVVGMSGPTESTECSASWLEMLKRPFGILEEEICNLTQELRVT